MIHAGEGVDAAARAEFERLDELYCIDRRTLLVHALGFDQAQFARLVALGAGAVWCPSSNLFLFGRTLDPRRLFAAGRLALGSDSRLSGARDLLEELREARRASHIDAVVFESLVTRDNARLLRLTDRGDLGAGLLADLVVIPAHATLADLDRRDLRLVMLGGRMVYGDAEYYRALEAPADCLPIEVEGAAKMLDRRHVQRLAGSSWREPGVVLPRSMGRAA
jgi:cytosine/adenosine deaminase-related metal-dependent hydrolase